MEQIHNLYKQIGRQLKIKADSEIITNLLFELHEKDCEFLANTQQISLISKVSNKQYFAFSWKNKLSRAVNVDLFIHDSAKVTQIINYIVNKNFNKTSSDEITKALYTIAISFCCIVDLSKQGDQKTPGTFFENFICHWFSKMLELQPVKEIDVLNLDMKTTLPTDFIFDLGVNKPKIHLPIKTSTRERVIQVWAHQRVLDGVYGMGRFLGMLVCLSETKVNKTSLEVVEICLPDQWRLYQMFIAQMNRIYYLDVPARYFLLNDIFPPINVRPFGEFFYDAQNLFKD